MCSLDGRIAGFPADVGLYYETAAQLPHQAVLTGSDTVIDGAMREGVDLTSEDVDPAPPGTRVGEDRPWLVVVDGRGRVRRLEWLRGQPYWRDLLILCHATTPERHLALLRRRRVEHLVAGSRRVALPEALHQLSDRYRVRQVRVDAGGTLNGVLLRAGLVDEVSVLVAPHLSGDARPGVAGPDGSAERLVLESVRQLRDGYLWLRYATSAAR
jgi:2,5-diamino-6-(ribosylamino)-4(3H)-pyrimidinone 5'-phosphate reductase